MIKQKLQAPSIALKGIPHKITITFNYRGCRVKYFQDGDYYWEHPEAFDPDNIEVSLISNPNPYRQPARYTIDQVLKEIDVEYDNLDLPEEEIAEVESRGWRVLHAKGDDYVFMRS